MLGVQLRRSGIEVELGYKYLLSMPGHNPWWYTWRAQLALPRNWTERTQVRLYPISGGDLRSCSSDRLSGGIVVPWGGEPHEPSRENQECGRRKVLRVWAASRPLRHVPAGSDHTGAALSASVLSVAR